MSEIAAERTTNADVALVGAGPIGIELAVALKRAGLDYVHFEARQIGHTISCWPPETHFFSSPERIAIAGVPIQTADQRHPTGEEYLAYLRSVVLQFDLEINTYERVLTLAPSGGGFRLRTATRRGERTWHCRRVVLATGGLAGPRRLGIPGEDLAHVAHTFRGPHMYFRRRLLVVGGRNSAVEAALRCWHTAADVTVSYRRREFDAEIVKPHILKEFAMRVRDGQIAVLPGTVPVEITPEAVLLAPADAEGRPADGPRHSQPADFVLLCTGFEADLSLMEQAGVELLGEERAPVFSRQTMETNVPGLYVVGTAVGGSQRQFKVFIENSHRHVAKVVAALTGEVSAGEPDSPASPPGRVEELSEEW